MVHADYKNMNKRSDKTYRFDILIVYIISSLAILWSIINDRTLVFTITSTALIFTSIFEGCLLWEGNSKKFDNGVFSALGMCVLIITCVICYHRNTLLSPHSENLQIVATLFFFIGVTIRFIAFKTLKHAFSYSLTISANHKLVTSGIYMVIRHPAYLGTFFYVLGIALLYQSIPSFIAIIVFIPITLQRIIKEEKMLRDYFGESFKRYQMNTKKILPFIF